MSDSDAITRLNTALEGRYRIERELGEGGMATVYLADDLRHERKVALKVLKPELAAVVGAERFLAEIKTTANLQHPHILPLFDSGEADSFLFYVMPYVEGESLRERLDREKQLPIVEAIAIATKLSGALQAAHSRGVVHRDIKPANILLGERGEPLVADFGIALALQEAGQGRLTETGLSVGTPFYMSPEQATGDREPDARSDVYALGAVLYEMLTGEPPFGGTTAQAVLARVLTAEAPAASDLRGSVPPNVEAAVQVALSRLPADRFASADALAVALADPGYRVPGVEAERGFNDAKGVRQLRGWQVATVALAALAAWFWWGTTDAWRTGPQVYDVGFPADAPMRLQFSESYSIPADGRFVVYEAATTPPQLWTLDLATLDAEPIPDTENASAPIVSTSGDRLYFVQDGQLHTSTLDGQGRTALSEFDISVGHMRVSEDRVGVMDRDGTVLRWYDAERQTEVDSTSYCLRPSFLSQDRLLCGGGGSQLAYIWDRNQLRPMDEIVGLEDDPSGEAPLRGADFTIIDDDYLVYVSRDGDLRGTIVDWSTLTAGRSVLLLSGLRREAYSGLGHYQITENGSLFYVPGVNAAVGRFVQKTGDDPEVPLPIQEDQYVRFSISPDGTRFAAVVDGLEAHELRTWDISAGWTPLGVWMTYTRIWHPEWRVGGSELVVAVHDGLLQPGTLVIGTPGDTEPRELPTGTEWEFPYSPSDYFSDSLIVGYDNHVTVLDVTATPPQVDTLTTARSWFPDVSPDQRWIAHADYGDFTIRVSRFPDMDPEYDVTERGLDPRWLSPTQLAYFEWPAMNFMRVEIDGVTGRPLGDGEIWFTDPRFADTPGPSFTVAPGGSVIYLQSVGRETTTHLRVIPDWVSEMKRLVDAANR